MSNFKSSGALLEFLDSVSVPDSFNGSGTMAASILWDSGRTTASGLRQAQWTVQIDGVDVIPPVDGTVLAFDESDHDLAGQTVVFTFTASDGTNTYSDSVSHTVPLSIDAVSPTVNRNTLTYPVQFNDGSVGLADSVTMTIKNGDGDVLSPAQNVDVAGVDINWNQAFDDVDLVIEIAAVGPDGLTANATLNHNLTLAIEHVGFDVLTPTATDNDADSVDLVASSLVTTISYLITEPDGTQRTVSGAANANIVGDDLMAGTFANPAFQTANAANAAGDHSVAMSVTGKVVDGNGNFVDGGTLAADSQTVTIASMIQNITVDPAATPVIAVTDNAGNTIDANASGLVGNISYNVTHPSGGIDAPINGISNTVLNAAGGLITGTHGAPVFNTDDSSLAAGNYQVTVSVTDTNTSVVTSETITVTVAVMLQSVAFASAPADGETASLTMTKNDNTSATSPIPAAWGYTTDNVVWTLMDESNAILDTVTALPNANVASEAIFSAGVAVSPTLDLSAHAGQTVNLKVAVSHEGVTVESDVAEIVVDNIATRGLASGSADKSLRFWDVSSGTLTQAIGGYASEIEDISWSPGGTLIAGGINDGTLAIWNAGDGTLAAPIFNFLSSDVDALAWSPGGTLLATGNDASDVNIWDKDTAPATGVPTATLTGHTDQIYAVAWSPDGSLLASGGKDYTVRLWNTSDWSLNRVITVSTLTGSTIYGVRWIAWNPSDNSEFATGDYHSNLKVWSATSGALLRDVATGQRTNGSGIGSVDWSANGKIATAGQNGTVKIWDVSDLSLAQTLTQPSGIVDVALWSPNDTMLAAGARDNKIHVWNTSDWSHQSLSGHTSRVRALAWNPLLN